MKEIKRKAYKTWIVDLLQCTQKNKHHEEKKTNRGQEDKVRIHIDLLNRKKSQ